ncbi:MAG: fumarylacetoacetate hydrolase family protein [Microcella sp.]|uniref:fumarylacetoacetate hydrolase family protein n=1 Tax=Microcella sp. TaxID=1913979 RepID=UPI0024C6261A|nr:fumarylacetoacetate hydrolase family protein [Microcella sp.]UYN82522.1 MAG: fumarylacetoacetate hydrolase family protein [Microcella sp.]
MAELLRLGRAEFRRVVETATRAVGESVTLLPPIDGRTEVWGGGVTYDRSRVARIEESESADVYERVYRADRPELFFKSPGWRVRTNHDPIAIRRDSALNVPEPELALWINAMGETLGYLVCNDMTSRSIEADNPLYLPQAKLYTDSCAISTGVVPFWAVDEPEALRITMSIDRGSTSVWKGSTSTANMARSFDELVRWLFADTDFPDGVILATGTGIVPELDFVVESGDLLTIEIDQVGTLSNRVVRHDAARPRVDEVRVAL